MNPKLLLALALVGAACGQTTPPSVPPDVIYPVIRIPPDTAALISERDDAIRKFNSLKLETAIVAIEAGIDSTVRLRGFYQIAMDQFGKTPASAANIKHNLQECDDRIDRLRKVIEALKTPLPAPPTLSPPIGEHRNELEAAERWATQPAPTVLWPNEVWQAEADKRKQDNPHALNWGKVFIIEVSGKRYEFGLRSDGCVVWRERK